jgi:hypothetical protein
MLCEIPKDRLDKDGCLPLSSVDELALDGCEIPEGVCFTLKEARTVKKEARMEPKDIVIEPAAPVVQTQAIVAQPTASDPSSQLMALAGKKDVSPMALGAGVVALAAGSGFLWKQIKDMVQGKREHELEMKKMESEKKEGDHKACAVQNAALAAQVQGLAGQMQGLAGQVQAIPEQTNAALKAVSEKIDAIDPKMEALSRRISKMETAAKKKAGAK